jgi:hypothetical protein
VSDIERRFARSLADLFGHYAELADRTTCLLNTGTSPTLVFTQHGEYREVNDPVVLRLLETWRRT